MEKNYLYPGDSVKPIAVGETYCDYRLSDILEEKGFGVFLIQPTPCLSDDGCFVVDRSPELLVSFRRGGKLGSGIGDSICCQPVRIIDKPFVMTYDRDFDDLVVRFLHGDKSANMRWVSLLKDGETALSIV